MNCPHPDCRERLALQGLIWIEKDGPVSAGTCRVHGVVKFKIREVKKEVA